MSLRRIIKRGLKIGVFGWVKAAFSFVALWFVTRSLRLLLIGLPAMILLTTIPVMAITSQSATGQLEVRRKYQKAAVQAAQGEDFEAAQLWYRKLLSLDPSDQDVKFRLALAIEETGDESRAQAMFNQLTPRKSAGYAPAHYYLAGRIIQDDEQPTPDEFRQIVWHLAKVLDQEPDDLNAQSLLARVQVARGERAAAADILEKMVVVRPELHLTLSGLYKQLGRADTAEQHASQARLHFQHLREQEPENVAHVIQLAESHALSLQFREAERLLLDQLDKKLDVEVITTELITLAILEVDLEIKKDQPDWPLVVSLLERSLAAAPLHSFVFPRIALIVGRFEGEKAEELRNILEDALADGRAPAVCHLLLGTSLGEVDKLEEAIQHLEAARKVFPKSPVVLNNLAYYLMETDPPQLETALEHANQAVELAPRSPEILETRGQILAALGRDDEALPDLEAALRMENVPSELHKTLSRVYTRLGHETMADRHRQRAAQKSK